MVGSVVDHMQGIQKHAFHYVHACNSTHSTPSPTQRQEASPTKVEHVLRQVDAHDHQNTLEDQHGHYASVRCQSICSQEDHVHVRRRVG